MSAIPKKNPVIVLQAATLAWVGGMKFGRRSLPFKVCFFEDSDDFLLAPDTFDFDFFIIGLPQKGVAGLDLIRLVRRRSNAGVLAMCKRPDEELVACLEAGADMVLDWAAPETHLIAAVNAVLRRSAQGDPAGQGPWTLRPDKALLETPKGKEISLSGSDLTILRCLASEGGKVERAVLIKALWGHDNGAMDNALHATLYRLRKRIEQVGDMVAPLHAVAKVGYEFRAPLEVEAVDQPGRSVKGSNISRKRR